MRFSRWMLLLAFAFFPAVSRAEDWPCWRGPRGDGTSLESKLPTKWSTGENVVWRIDIPGKGHSSPIVSGDRIFVATAIEDQQQRVLLCLDRRDGRTLWQQVVLQSPLEKKHELNSFASATPATDGKHVWVSFFKQPNIVLACFDLDGKEVWRKSPGTFNSPHGFCSSPLLYNNLVILNCDQDAPAWIVAYDKHTGEEKWRADRPNRTRSYCTPTVIDVHGKKQLVLSGSKCIASYDPDTGKQLWLIDGPTEQMVASLVYRNGVLFYTGGFPDREVLGIDPTGSGNVSTSHVRWRNRQGASYVPSPVAYGDWFFLVADETGLATCWESGTGKLVWKHRLGRRHSASGVVSADGLLYWSDDDGVTYVLKAGPKFELVSKNDLDEPCSASPAVSRGQLFIRTLGHLYCIGK